MLMAYARFREEARDIDRLRQSFGVSFEQACHRLSTLQRPDTRGVPFFFCSVDMAGNITNGAVPPVCNSLASADLSALERA
jgi:XRE family transcriptional regulator, fatty acid utilization regulator